MDKEEEEISIDDSSDLEEKEEINEKKSSDEDKFKVRFKSKKSSTKLKEKVEVLEKQIEDLNNKNLRIQAEFDNYKKRSKKDLEEMAKFGSRKIVSDLLSVLDNFERALVQDIKPETMENFSNGIKMIHKQLIDILENEGLEYIEAEGKPFDHNFHEGILNEEVEDEDLIDHVVGELQKGYVFKGKVIRPTMAKIGIKK